MAGSLVDQDFLASSDKMFPVNQLTKANSTSKYTTELNDQVVLKLNTKDATII